MPGPDREKQERLLNFAGWLHHKHRFQTRPHGEAFTEVRFTRDTLGQVPALSAYSPDAGDAGERALIRDVDDLREFGIDLRWEAATQQWVSRAAPLNDQECRALATAALRVLVEDGTLTSTGYHVPGAGLTVESAELVVAYAPIVDRLVEAIRTRSEATFIHRGTERVVDPWHVFMSNGRWYLIGRDHDSAGRRVFALDAVESLEIGEREKAFEIPESDWAHLSERISNPDEWIDGDEIDITLAVHPRLVGRAESLLGAEAAGGETRYGWVEMSCTVRNVDAFIDRLWNLRARAVVTSPPGVRTRIVDYLRETLD